MSCPQLQGPSLRQWITFKNAIVVFTTGFPESARKFFLLGGASYTNGITHVSEFRFVEDDQARFVDLLSMIEDRIFALAHENMLMGLPY